MTISSEVSLTLLHRATFTILILKLDATVTNSAKKNVKASSEVKLAVSKFVSQNPHRIFFFFFFLRYWGFELRAFTLSQSASPPDLCLLSS
jgi:hypothetical protein